MRAAWLGTVRSGDLSGKALSQQVENLKVSAQRGTIFDRNGVELAVSEDSVTVFADPLLIKNPVKVAAQVAPLINRPEQEVLKKVSNRSTGFVYLARKVN